MHACVCAPQPHSVHPTHTDTSLSEQGIKCSMLHRCNVSAFVSACWIAAQPRKNSAVYSDRMQHTRYAHEEGCSHAGCSYATCSKGRKTIRLCIDGARSIPGHRPCLHSPLLSLSRARPLPYLLRQMHAFTAGRSARSHRVQAMALLAQMASFPRIGLLLANVNMGPLPVLIHCP